MPWPPTFQTDLPIPISDQLTSVIPAGLNTEIIPGLEGEGVPVDQMAGIVAPGVMSPTDFGLDALPEPPPEQEKLDIGAKRQAIIDDALTQIGKWYVWGGESDAEGGFDCSGLLFWAFKKNGVEIPRVSGAQAASGKRVDISKLRPGDFVAWENNPDAPGADHIALYLGDGWILEAPRTGLKVRKRKLRANEGAWGVQMDY